MSDHQPDHQPASIVHVASAEKQATELTPEQKTAAVKIVADMLKENNKLTTEDSVREGLKLMTGVTSCRTKEALVECLDRMGPRFQTNLDLSGAHRIVMAQTINEIGAALGLDLGRS